MLHNNFTVGEKEFQIENLPWLTVENVWYPKNEALDPTGP